MSSQNLFSRRLGKFKLSKEVILSTPDIAFTILSTVIPIRAELMLEDDSIHYIALSHSFEVVGHGYVAPTYVATVEDHRTTWKRADE